MPDDKVVQVIVPESLQVPLQFDLWRIRVDDNKNLVIDFARKVTDEQLNLVSSIMVENSRIDRFIIEFLNGLYTINKQHELNIKLLEEAEKTRQKEEE